MAKGSKRQRALEERRRRNRRRANLQRRARPLGQGGGEEERLPLAALPEEGKTGEEKPLPLPQEDLGGAAGAEPASASRSKGPVRRFLARWPRALWARRALFFLLPLVTLFCCQLATLQTGEAVLAWAGEHPQAAILTYLLLLGLETAAEALVGWLFLAAAVVDVPALILAIASHLKEVANGAPLLVSDLSMALRAGDVAGFLRPGMSLGEGTVWAIGCMAAALLLALLFGYRPREKRRRWYLRLAAGVLAASAVAASAFLPACLEFLRGGEEESQAQRNDRLGLLAGVYSGVLQSAVEEPDAYNENNMNVLLLEAREQARKAAPAMEGKTPHVVLLMSESFCDPTAVLPGVDFLEDPIPHFRALAEEWPSGEFLSNTYAGGTGNVEMEVMTGVPIAMVGEGEDLTSLRARDAYRRIPSIVRAFGEAGYATQFVHSYTTRLYNREENLPQIGFEKLTFEPDFEEDAPREGPYLSDMALTEEMIRAFEEREEGKPLFLFGLSMENHQPYFSGKFPESSGLAMESEVLDEEAMGMVDALCHGLRDADAALGELLAYFESQEEPVLVIFWGDHLPGLAVDEEHTLYSLLDYCTGANTKTWSPEELKRMHLTRFLVWNNYGADLEVPPVVSACGLGSKILGWAGVEKPLYFHWVDRCMEDVLLYRKRLFVAASGEPSYVPKGEAKAAADAWRTLVYDLLYGEGYLSKEMAQLPER